ncbi:glutamate receptor 1-like [Homarus americanus]|uniref:glutamate receptor 1-like n=1 Tax=Homarus americanus TaxID=6706 RepID=UPI001C459A2A|nr:glutamate receptor 1-like [Homarus americanus]
MTAAAGSPPCLKVAVEEWAPFVMLIDRYSKPPKLNGTLISVLDIIAQKLNFCYEIVVPREGYWGAQLSNGSWTGIMGMVVRKEIAMSGTVLTIGEARAKAVDFSVPLYTDQLSILYKLPSIEADLTGFVKPYTLSSWLLFLATMVVVFIMTFFVQWSRARPLPRPSFDGGSEIDDDGGRTSIRTVRKPLEAERSVRASLWTSCLGTLTALLAQSSSWLPRGDSLRIIAGTWLLMAFILGSVYRSNLKAMLILPKLRLPFNSLEELVQTDIPCIVLNGSLVHSYMMLAPEGNVLHKLRQQAVVPKDFVALAPDVPRGKFAFLASEKGLLYLIHAHFALSRKCPMYMASEPFLAATSLSFAFPFNSSLKRQVDPIIQRLKESGILDYLHFTGIRNVEICFNSKSFGSSTNTQRSFNLRDFYGVFCVYAGGMLVGLVSFLLELVYSPRAGSPDTLPGHHVAHTT